MAIGSANPLLLASAAADSDPVTRSLRFNDGDSATLTRTPGSAGDGSTFTVAMWVKIGSKASYDVLFSASDGSSDQDAIYFDSSTYKLKVKCSGISGDTLVTAQEFRDPTGWFHLTAAYDYTQSTATNRLRLYVNGAEITAFDTDSRSSITQHSSAAGFNTTRVHTIGNASHGGSDYFDGHIADFYFIDGTAVTPVGNFIQDTGYNSYKPKAFDMSSYSGNSFHLEFEETGVGTGSSTTVGADTSGQDNHFDSTNIAASDVMLDTPTTNYPVINPLDKASTTHLSDGNLVIQPIGAGTSAAFHASMPFPESGKWYYEVTVDTVGTGSSWVHLTFGKERHAYDLSAGGFYFYRQDGDINGNSNTSFSNGSVIGVAYDADNNTLTYYHDGTQQHQFTSVSTSHKWWAGGMVGNAGGSKLTANFGQKDFSQTVPTGFEAFNTSKLDDPTVKAHENFNTITYGGTASSRSLGGVGFQPNMTWIKQRSSPNRRHHIQDSLRTAGRSLFPDADTSEEVNSNYVTSFDSDGFSLGTSSEINGSSIDYVAWNWKENASAGFDIVTWAGDSGSSGSGYSEQSVSHSLGVAPEMIIAKARSDNALSSNYYLEDWAVYHKDLSSDYFLNLNLTSAQTQHDGSLFSSIGASSVSFGNDGYASQYLNYADYYTSAENYVAYLFASVDGVCKVGSYTGNASSDGPTVYCGFRPAFVMVKRIANSGSWYLWDNKRGPHNVINNTLYPNSAAVESGTGGIIDFTATGFKIRSTGTDINSSGEKRIFLAMAESPLKYANAR